MEIKGDSSGAAELEACGTASLHRPWASTVKHPHGIRFAREPLLEIVENLLPVRTTKPESLP